MDLAQRFRELRARAGLTGMALASPRYAVSYVSHIESGRRVPSSRALRFFAGRLGVSAEFLATGVPDGIVAKLSAELEEARGDLRSGMAAEGEMAVRQVLETAQRFGLGRVQAEAAIVLGDSLRQQGRAFEAVQSYEEALRGDISAPEDGMAVAGLARACLSTGDLSRAAELVESYLSRSRERPIEAALLIDLHSALVPIYFERGDILRAERAAQRALAAIDDHTPAPVRAVAYWHASRIVAERKRWDEALDLAARARELMELAGDRRRAARLHNVYAFICLETDPPRTEEARHHLELAERVLADAAAPSDRAEVLTERSRLALLEGRPDVALDYVERALMDAASDRLELARCLFLKGRALGALQRREEAQTILLESAGLFKDQGARQQEANCWREIGELDLARGDVTAAVDALRAGLAALDPRSKGS